MGKQTKTIAYGIDFGTSNSLLSRVDDSGAHALVDVDPFHETDPKILRSIFYISDQLEWSFGSSAIENYTSQSGQGRLIRSIKKYLPDESFEGTMVGRKKMSIVEIIGRFLTHLRNGANLACGQDVDSVVMGRPAVFSISSVRDQLAETRLREACILAGFKNIEFCPEPLAAGLSVRGEDSQSGKVVAICDFGGGTSDFSVLRFQTSELYEVLAIGGVSLAGDAYDGLIMKNSISPLLGADISYKLPSGSNTLHLPKHIINKLCSAPDINFIGQTEAFELLQSIGNWALDADKKAKLENLVYIIEEKLGFKLFESIESTKVQLSSVTKAPFDFQHYDLQLCGSVEAKEFEAYSSDMSDKIISTLKETVKSSGLSFDDIDTVYCTGGTAHIPALRSSLKDLFGPEKIKKSHEFHSVISGLAQRAYEIFR